MFERVEVERLGGLGGFGLPGSRIRSCGALTFAQLAEPDRAVVDALFARGASVPLSAGVADGFRYRLTLHDGASVRTIEVPEADMPAALTACVHDQLV